LDIQGVTLLCWGSRIDVWPNSQQFQWAGGLVAHRHVMGEPTWITNEDGYEERVAGTRMIFDYEADGVVSVVDQRNYRVLLRQYSLNLSKLGIDKEVEALQMTLDDFERLINTIRTLKKDRPTI